MENKMFCFQCQETAQCTGCTRVGVCGKSATTATLQDLLIYATKGLCEITTKLRQEKQDISRKLNQFICENLFITITNANFDDDIIIKRITDTLNYKQELLAKLQNKNNLSPVALWTTNDENTYLVKGATIGVLATENEDIRSLRELITYGLKGMAAYNKHANALGKFNDEIDSFLQATLAKTVDNNLSGEELTALALETGAFGVKVMALLDEANTSRYGNPEITSVDIGVRNNPAILISGHDLRDLEMLLEQTQGTGVDVYTHSEMLPAHYYPFFKKYKNFAGNYGNAWWKQKEEFLSFNGPILLTTNCLVPPKADIKIEFILQVLLALQVANIFLAKSAKLKIFLLLLNMPKNAHHQHKLKQALS